MPDVFISYSRRDQPFVRRLHDRLAKDSRDVWVDWEDIPPTAKWWSEIEGAIEGSEAVVFVISPDSIASETWRRECDHAARYHKRIVPVVSRDIERGSSPELLSGIQWLFLRDGDDFEAGYRQVITALETDLDWVRTHSRLLVRAREWETSGRDKGFLLGGADLAESERTVLAAIGKQPVPAQVQLDYLAASREGQVELQRRQLRGFYIVSIVYGVLQSVVSYIVAFDEISEEGLIALSPLWVLGLVFGAFGLTLGRNSMRRSVVATGVAAALFYLFFQLFWASL